MAAAAVPERMEALVVSAPERFAIAAVPVPVPAEDELLCRVRAVSICGTDPHIIRGEFPGFWPKAWPFVPGHEWSGEVVAVGARAALYGWLPGDRVAGTSHAGCGFCTQCVRGRYNLCEQFGNEAVHRQYGHYTQGAYATYVVHSIRSVVRLPDALSYELGTFVDPASIALHTARRAAIPAGGTVVVWGPGVQGLLGADCARALGAGRVIVVGRGARLRIAAELGHETIDVSAGDAVGEVRARTGGVGADAALECAGVEQALVGCIACLRKGARVAVIGIPPAGATLPIREIVLNELEIVGVRANAGELEMVLPLIADRRVRTRELITHRFGLRDYAQAYAIFTERRDGALKVILTPEDAA